MSDTPSRPTKKRMSREEQAHVEVGHTEMSRGTAWGLLAAFLLVIIGLPLVDEIKKARTANGPDAFTSIVTKVPKAFREGWRSRPTASAPVRFNQGNKQVLKAFSEYEDDLKDDSILSGLIQPMQAFNTRTLLQGNELAVLGEDGWIFLKPGIDYLTGPPFLSPKRLKARALGAPEWEDPPEPDPRPALLEFNDFLKRQGVKLVVVPAPVKPQIHPEHVSKRFADAKGPLNNPSFAPFVSELEAAGITVVDLAPVLWAHKDAYLKTDTHWTSEGMQRACDAIVAALALPRGTLKPTLSTMSITNVGDLVSATLDLENAGIFAPEVVALQQFSVDGTAFDFDDPAAEVVFLGDSFANIYSENEGLGWGDRGGLRDHLVARLKQPIYAITKNDNGAFATREELYRRSLAKGTGFWKNKNVVIYEFAARELAVGNWKTFDWSAVPETEPKAPTVTKPVEPLEVTGKIARLSRPPRPGSVAYKDCIVQLHLTELKGLEGADQAVVRMFGMRDNVWTEATKYEVGDVVTLNCEDWTSAANAKNLATLKVENVDLPLEILISDPPELWSEPSPKTP